jgi:hypothetical protein
LPKYPTRKPIVAPTTIPISIFIDYSFIFNELPVIPDIFYDFSRHLNAT